MGPYTSVSCTGGSQGLWDVMRKRLRHFTWAWFCTTMATGSVAVVLHQTPHQFNGLATIGTIVFIIDLVLFCIFSIAMIFRFILRPEAMGESLHIPSEAFYFGTFWVSVALMLTNIAQYGVSSCGPWLVEALVVCFWCYGAAAIIVAVFQYYLLFITETLKINDMLPAWIFPIYPLLVAGPLAGVILKYHPSHPLDIWMGGVVFQGLGWTVATFLYVMWLLRLLDDGLPEPSRRPAMYVAVGPTGYTSQALILLGYQAPIVLPSTFFNVVSVSAGEVIKIIGSLAGIFIWLVGFWFFCFATLGVIQGRKQMSFSLSCWAYVFPNAGFTLATIQIAVVLNSDAIKWLTSAMTIILVAVWLLVGLFHIKALWHRQILWEGRDEDANMSAP